jgi:hypothetical protein
MDRFAVAVAAGVSESDTCTVNWSSTGAWRDGTPVIRPVAGTRVSPAGSVPPVIDQVYGPVPPAAASLAR